jgi:peptidoglycan/xylan/chitin deacetylase (PgdA/CDA1 family)
MTVNKKYILNSILSQTGTSSFCRYVDNLLPRKLLILAYHRVLDYDESYSNGDIELISASNKDFEKQITYLKNYYYPITFKVLNKHLKESIPFPKTPVIITFDDGFRDNYTNAYRILKKHKIPATFFISTDAISQKTLFWFDLVAFLILKHTSPTITIHNNIINIGSDIESKRKCIKSFLSYLKKEEDHTRKDAINELIAQSNAYDEYSKERRSMTWDEVKIMNNNGMEIGSHSVSHPKLTKLSNKEATYEIKHSKETIETKLDCCCDTYSYQVGGEDSYNNHILELIENSNYKFACTYQNGINYLNKLSNFRLDRIHVERYTNFHSFKTNLILSS